MLTAQHSMFGAQYASLAAIRSMLRSHARIRATLRRLLRSHCPIGDLEARFAAAAASSILPPATSSALPACPAHARAAPIHVDAPLRIPRTYRREPAIGIVLFASRGMRHSNVLICAARKMALASNAISGPAIEHHPARPGALIGPCLSRTNRLRNEGGPKV